MSPIPDPTVDVATGAFAVDRARLRRIRWRCRRGMLENDLVLERFLDERGGTLREDEIAMLDVLLDLPDNTLWELIAGLAEPEDGRVAPLVGALRRTCATRGTTQPDEGR